MTSLAEVEARDRADPLRAFRDGFDLPEGLIYLDGNSLGPLPRATRAAMERVMDREWGESLIQGWNDAGWIDAPRAVGDKIARLIGGRAGEAAVADSTSVNLFKLLVAAVRARPGRTVILTEAGNFPTDLYIAKGIADLLPGVRVLAVERDEVAARLDDAVAVLLLTHVHYKSAARWDMAAMTAAAHAAGALALWDLSHSVGAIRVDLAGAGADLAVGCGYKYLNGGPGAPAFLYVRRDLQAALASPLTGWMGHAAGFDFSDDWRPADGIARFLCGTPPILATAALEAGVDLALEADMALVETKSAALFDLFVERLEARLASHGFRLITPRDEGARGSHLAIAHPEGWRIMRALIRRGVIGDFRAPDVLRFGLTPLYLRFADIWRAVEILGEVMERGAWRDEPSLAAGVVT